jgi:hypothetical protein
VRLNSRRRRRRRRRRRGSGFGSRIGGADDVDHIERTDGRSAAAFYDYIWWRCEFQQRHADGRKRVDEYEYDAGDEWGGETRWGASRSGDARVCVRGERE